MLIFKVGVYLLYFLFSVFLLLLKKCFDSKIIINFCFVKNFLPCGISMFLNSVKGYICMCYRYKHCQNCESNFYVIALTAAAACSLIPRNDICPV